MGGKKKANGEDTRFKFLISNKFIDVKKKGEHPSTQEVYKGWNNQEQKLQESKKSRKDKNDWFRNATNQSITILKKNSFKSNMDLSLSSKYRLFLSLQSVQGFNFDAVFDLVSHSFNRFLPMNKFLTTSAKQC